MSKVEEKYAFHQGAPFVLSDGTVLKRIVALRDIPLHNVKAGDVGGYIEDEKMLKQTGSSWVGGDAKIYGHSRVLDDSLVTDYAELFHSLLTGDVIVSGQAKLSESALKGERIVITGRAMLVNVGFTGKDILIKDDTQLVNLFGRSTIHSFTVSENAVLRHIKNMEMEGTGIRISGNAQIVNAASICGNNITISGEAVLENNADIKGNNVTLQDFCRVTNVTLKDNVEVRECASVISSHDDLYPSISNTIFNGDMEYDISPF